MSPTDSDPPRARVAEARRNRQNLVAVAARAFACDARRVPLRRLPRKQGSGSARFTVISRAGGPG